METPAPREPAVERHPSADRIIAFTDAAVAIALTLLVLPLMESVASVTESGEGASFSAWLTENAGSVSAFGLSFLMVALYWTRHHAAMLMVRRFAGRMLTANFVWILAIVLLPVTSAVAVSFTLDAWSVGAYLSNLALIGVTLAWIEIETMRFPEVEEPSDAQWSRLSASILSVVLLALCFVLVVWTPMHWGGMVAMALAGPLGPVTRTLVRRLRGRRASR